MENENKTQLIDYLFASAKQKGFRYKIVYTDPDDPPVSFKPYKIMFINFNWHNHNELPFAIAHEMGHLSLADFKLELCPTFAGKNAEERSADLYALKLLYRYSCQNGDDFTEPGAFMEAYGIPNRMAAAAKRLFQQQKNKTIQ